MIRSIPTSRSAAVAALALSMLIPTSPAQAQERDVRRPMAPATLRQQAIEHARKTAVEQPGSSLAQVTKVRAPKRERSTTRKVVGAALAGTAGFFAGGYLGAVIDGDCGGCDDPGLKGALIGAPIGAAVGVVLGALFF